MPTSSHFHHPRDSRSALHHLFPPLSQIACHATPFEHAIIECHRIVANLQLTVHARPLPPLRLPSSQISPNFGIKSGAESAKIAGNSLLGGRGRVACESFSDA